MSEIPGEGERTTFSLRDGRTMELRRLRPDDVERMMGFIARLSRETVRMRFLAPVRVDAVSTRQLAERLSTLDFVDNAAFVACFPGEEEIRAIGRYAGAGAGAPEIAFVVEDRLQGQGIGTTLLRVLSALARENGYARLSAQMLTENREMLRVFRASGYPLKLKLEGDTERVEMDITPGSSGG
jgi:GNAT superfamily N-acetyltransferase